MRTFTILALFIAVAATSPSQVSVTGTFPAQNATGVSTSTTITITFSGAIDTTQGFRNGDNYFTNIASLSTQAWSVDRRTISLQVTLLPSSVYFFLVHSVKPVAGGGVTVPYLFYWTTGTSFPTTLHSVSGTITSGGSPVSPDNAIVGLGIAPFAGGPPDFIGAAVTNGSGQFTIPYVPNGTWYPIAAKDADQNGSIDPGMGDPIAFGDSVIVSGADVSGFVMAFVTFPPLHFSTARDSITSHAARTLPANRDLRQFMVWGVDSTGAAREWVAMYTVSGSPVVTELAMESTGLRTDTSSISKNYVYVNRPYPGLASAITLDSIIARAERSGGREFRRQSPPVAGSHFDAYARLGALNNTEFNYWISDTSKYYWGLQYMFQIPVNRDSSYSVAWKLFLADAVTGQLLMVTGADERNGEPLPAAYALGQNYPNPFNPSTTINFALPVRSRVTLEVYNLLGQRVASLLNEERNAGSYDVKWMPSSPSGMYLYRLEAVGSDAPSHRFVQVRKMVYIK